MSLWNARPIWVDKSEKVSILKKLYNSGIANVKIVKIKLALSLLHL